MFGLRIPARSVGSLLAALMGVFLLLALGSEASLWAMGVWFVATGLGLYGAWHGRLPWFSAAQRLMLGLFLLALALLLAGWGNWLAMASQAVLVLLAVKALEIRSQRDFYQVAALVLLGMGVAAWLRVDVLLGIFVLAAVYLSLLGLLWQPLADAAVERTTEGLRWRDFRYMLVFSLVFLLVLLPVTAIFFLILPRTPTPLWAWAPPQGDVHSGFSADLSPDSMAHLALDSATVFRAQISPPPADPERLYWVGAILWRDEGRSWVPDPPAAMGQDAVSAEAGATGVRQKIVLSPDNSNYLFALAAPYRLNIPVTYQQQADGVLRLDKAPGLPMRYTVWSAPAAPRLLSAAERAAALQVPADTNPDVRALAARFVGGSDAVVVQRLLHWFQEPFFRYSLQVPTGYPHGQGMADFLLHTHTGFCEYYAGGLALLLRLDGIPARVVTGYHGGEYNPVGSYWIVRQSMAHAWVQAWLPGRGWVRLDATPALMAPSQGGSKTGTLAPHVVPGAQQLWDWMQWQWINMVIDLTPAKQRALWNSAGLQLMQMAQSSAHAPRWRPKASDWHWHAVLAYWLVGVSVLLLMVWLLWRRHRADQGKDGYWRQHAARALRTLGLRDVRPGVDSLFWQQLPVPADQWASVREIYLTQRYGPTPDADGARLLSEALVALRQSLRKTS
ncbi:transglutaminaseTgpA domain-containing protein [Acidithiobacillus sp.]|jgi:transglutaminase-like putative cysteine protease|uniref:transglutaminase family protein n=1 Tax=Acidithiobacillus sp. TaxID=1872118 RepID=UPI0025C6F9CB|nr:transglutaminaseTgpA domain-containing protein [Acidithiobacillus sp.]MCK9188368.1 transglutaminaseTgpA domain-containing protein [Acidithiobacillus sp.]MCK9358789.1 transglutaminaseTgpA domain-containing protein [Acidithiobacillus sp.]